ncbi:MAG TPA: CRISPR-associated endonuclease Cas1 [Allosphingosinicella sp.]|jgi:CRISPR-associated endonuclease Cas1|nr:CRISPR-associated endonuclease Cas1 [Allosphingosinicella sp.]
MTFLEPLSPHAEAAVEPQFSGAKSAAPDNWAERCEIWKKEAATCARPRRKRERNPNPLILCGHGASLRVENGALVIRDGFTHYPQEQARHRFFPRDLELPGRILLLDGSGTLSFDVLSWLSQQGVALARVSWTGEVATVASGTGYAADRDKLSWQRETRTDEAKRLSFAAELIERKLAASLTTLERHVPESDGRAIALAKAQLGIERLRRERLSDMSAIFAIEGECAAAYFAAWRGLSISWKALGRRPVPSDWHRYGARSSTATGIRAKNRNASHPLNAMLNYAYAVKLAAMKIEAIAEGYDPTFGIMHNGYRDNPAFVLDLIEPERPRVDAAILEFVDTHTFAAADFVILPNGSCRLAPQLARAVATLSV